LADKHGFLTEVPEPWEKVLVGGSDDHSSLNIARTFTEVTDADSVDTFLQEISNRVLLQFAGHLLDHFSGAHLFDMFNKNLTII
jgi:hypothetical protein